MEPRCIVFGGGGGGSGRSTIAGSVARALAQRGRSVLLVDASPQGGIHHLGWASAPSPARRDADLDSEHFDFKAAIVGADRNKPALLSVPFARRGAAFPMRARAQNILHALREQSWDDIVFDLDGRIDGFNATLLALCDVPILLTTTEAGSLSQSLEALRALVVYALLVQPEADTVERRLLDALESLPAQFHLSELQEAFAHSSIGPLLDRVFASVSPWILLNQTRDAKERDLGQSIAYGFGAITGIRPRVLGAIGWDEQRGDYIRRGALHEPLHGPGDTITNITQRLLRLEGEIDQQPRLPPGVPPTPTHTIGIPQTSSAQRIRRRWRELWDGLRQQSNFTEFILPTETREHLLAQLEDTNQALQQWLQAQEPATNALSSTAQPDHAIAQTLRRARTRKELSVRDLSLRSRIGLRYLEAIEAFEINALPREVYLRGYLREIARALDLDPDDLVQNYLTALHTARADALKSG